MKTTIFTTLFICLLIGISQAQSNVYLARTPRVEVETSKGKATFERLRVGVVVPFRVWSPEIEAGTDKFSYEVESRDSAIRITPHPGKPGWWDLELLAPIQYAHFAIYLHADKNYSIQSAFPKDRNKPIQDTKGRFIKRNIIWGKKWVIGPEGTLLNVVKLYWFDAKGTLK